MFVSDKKVSGTNSCFFARPQGRKGDGKWGQNYLTSFFNVIRPAARTDDEVEF
jgi:hypothetical protein